MNREKSMAAFQATKIYALTAENLSAGRTNLEVVAQMLAGGIKFLQYREKEKKARAMYEECLAIRKLTDEYGAALIIDDFADLALAVGADGVHIGQDDLPPTVVRRLVGDGMAIGLSTHSPAQLANANELARQGIVDYFGVGPVFATHTKKDVCAAVGLDYVRYAAANAVAPFVAIGGIKTHNIAAVAAAGAKTIGVVSAITGAADIAGEIAALKKNMAGK